MTDEKNNGETAPHLLSGAYSLDAVTPEEAERFEKAANASPELRQEADEFAETAAILGLAAEPVVPSAAMKAGLMSMIASTPQEAAAEIPVAEATVSEATVAPKAQGSEPAAAGPIETRARDRWFGRPVGVLTAAVAAIALFVGGGFVGVAITNPAEAPTVDQASVNRLAEISAADDAQRASTPVSGGGSATLVWSNELGESAVIINDLPALSADEVYEAWYIDDTGATAAGTFRATASGTTWHVLDGVMSAGDTVGVTIEPAGGSEQPTTDPIFAVSSS